MGPRQQRTQPAGGSTPLPATAPAVPAGGGMSPGSGAATAAGVMRLSGG